MKDAGHKVGILTGESTSIDDIKSVLSDLKIDADFIIQRPEDLKDFPIGIFKGEICKKMGIDVLFDDFQCSDPTIISDFFSVNNTTIPFTSWAYQNVINVP